MSLPSLFATIFAQAANTATTTAAATGTLTGDASAQPQQPPWMTFFPFILILATVYFALIRPQQAAKKKADETVRAAKTGDKIVTNSGIHGVITNVKDSTVILKIADNVKIEIEKSSIDKITRGDSSPGPEKVAAAKA
jgi:preprotein translocase subunit YajC